MLLASTGVSTGVVRRGRIHLCGIGVLANISACLAEAKGSKPLYRAILWTYLLMVRQVAFQATALRGFDSP